MSARSEISPKARAPPSPSSRSTVRPPPLSTGLYGSSRTRPRPARSPWCRRARPITACAATSRCMRTAEPSRWRGPGTSTATASDGHSGSAARTRSDHRGPTYGLRPTTRRCAESPSRASSSLPSSSPPPDRRVPRPRRRRRRRGGPRPSPGSMIGPPRRPGSSGFSGAGRSRRLRPTPGATCPPARCRCRRAGRPRPACPPAPRLRSRPTIEPPASARHSQSVERSAARIAAPTLPCYQGAAGAGLSPQETAMAADMRPRGTNNGAIKLVAGNSNPALADAIAAYLETPLTKAVVRRFADMEIFVEIQENVRGSDVFVIQSTSYPANDHLMELLIIIDALRRASGRRVTAVVPYFGYARQDRKPGPRTPISAKLVANLITRAGADRVMTLDLHAGQIQGFFDIPTDNLYAAPMMVRDIKERFEIGKVMVVSPDVGGVGRARGLAKRINAPLAIVDKRRERAGESEVMNVIGEVDGHTCILVDDIIDSGGTVVNAADALLEQGATDVYADITHGVLSGGAVARITASRLKELVITDSIQPTQAVKVARNIRTLSVATLIGEAIGRTAAEESVSSLFD